MDSTNVRDDNQLGLLPRYFASVACSVAVVGSLVCSLILLVKHDVLGGPGDQLTYYSQAERLIPFTDHYYGPGYFVAIRLAREAGVADWFMAGKIVSWISACVCLLFTFLIARRLLDARSARLATALVAINPIFISQSYSSLTIMYGAAWSLCAIWATLANREHRVLGCLGAGLLFGLASLTRFQNHGFLLGAVAGFSILPGVRWPRKLAGMAALLVGALIPTLLWSAYLLQVQGSIPKNYNFIHLTPALGNFTDFFQVPEVIDQYKGTLGVLTAHWSNPFKIAAFGVKEAVKFPFGIGFLILFVAAGWLVPGLVAVTARRSVHGPWLGAFAVGLFLTGVGSRGWIHYYVVFLPFCALLISHAIGAAAPSSSCGARLAWAIVLASTAAWAPSVVRSEFSRANWSEYRPAVAYLEEHKTPEMLVSSSASSLSYQAGFAFVDQSSMGRAESAAELVETLRRNKVTHLVVTERHTLKEYPNLAGLLEDKPRSLPAGFRRELLITTPRRLAIYRVLAPAPAPLSTTTNGVWR